MHLSQELGDRKAPGPTFPTFLFYFGGTHCAWRKPGSLDLESEFTSNSRSWKRQDGSFPGAFGGSGDLLTP